MGPNLSISVNDERDNLKIVNFVGEFDKAGHAAIKDQLDKTVDSLDKDTLLFDFSSLKFINSEGIGYLMEIHTHLVQRGKKLVIVSVKDHIADVFKTIGINEIIPIFKDLNEYLNQY